MAAAVAGDSAVPHPGGGTGRDTSARWHPDEQRTRTLRSDFYGRTIPAQARIMNVVTGRADSRRLVSFGKRSSLRICSFPLFDRTLQRLVAGCCADVDLVARNPHGVGVVDLRRGYLDSPIRIQVDAALWRSQGFSRL